MRTDSPADESAGTRYLISGWTGTGSVPLTGSSNAASFRITSNSSLTWAWNAEHRIQGTGCGLGTVDVAEGWYAEGSLATIRASPTGNAIFLGWSGDVPAIDLHDNPLSLAMDGPKTITAHFLAPTGDLDGDGMDDAWELRFFGATARNGLDDWDHDGMKDYPEYLAGTNPTNAADHLSIAAWQLAGADPKSLVLRWHSVTGRTYNVISSTNILAPSWITNGLGIAGNSGIRSLTNNCSDGPVRFFRLQVQLQ